MAWVVMMVPLPVRQIIGSGQQTLLSLSQRIRAATRPPETEEDHNLRALQVQIGWSAIFFTAATFNAAFAVRLGATDVQIGWLSSIPALIAIIVSIPAGRFLDISTTIKLPSGRSLEVRQSSLRWITGSFLVHRLGFALIILMPWIIPKPAQGLAVVVLLVVMTFPANIFSVGFVGLLADLIPEEKRANVFTIRNVFFAVVISLGTFLAGQWLNLAPFPLNYQALYFVGLLGGLASFRVLRRLTQPEFSVRFASERSETVKRFSVSLSSFRAVMQENADFVRFIVNTFLHSVAFWALTPLYILFFVRQLGTSDAWLGLLSTVTSAATILGWLFWRRVVVRWGERRTLTLTVHLLGLYPLIAGLSGNLTVILLGAVLNGLVTPGVSLSHTNTLLKVFPAGQRATYMGIYTTLMNTGAFIFPLIGVVLGRHFGLAPTLIGMGILWIVLSSGFRIWPVRVPDTLQTASLAKSGVED